jgi:arsenical pump membrane protein
VTQVASVSILALTISLSLSRPTIAGLKLHPGMIAALGAACTVALGLVPFDLFLNTVRNLSFPIVTIASLMVITLVAERAGLLQLLSDYVGTAARGDGRRLFTLIFCCGALTGTVFTNDAAVMIFTPLVVALVDDVADESWTPAQKIPYYFAVLNVANLVGALVISNPINIVVSGWFGIRFGEYAAWMMVPALVSMVVTFIGLRLVFRGVLPRTCRAPRSHLGRRVDPRLTRICAVVLCATLAGLFSESWTGLPTWLVAFAGAGALLMCATALNYSPRAIVMGVSWDVLVFVVGIFIIIMGLRNAGLIHNVSNLLAVLGGNDLWRHTFATGFIAATCASIMNNHPTADMMTWVIQDLHWPELETKLLVFAGLIGGDLGPKMLPLGSLAALIWFRLLADRGIEVSYWQYIKIGIPVALAGVVAAIAVLLLEYRLYVWWMG